MKIPIIGSFREPPVVRVVALRDIITPNPDKNVFIPAEVKTRVGAGTLGLLIGLRTHFDLGAVWKTGSGFGYGNLPIYQDLVIGTDIAVLEDWDGTQGLFTDHGWDTNPLLGMRESFARRKEMSNG